MPIDPDVQTELDAVNKRLDELEAATPWRGLPLTEHPGSVTAGSGGIAGVSGPFAGLGPAVPPAPTLPAGNQAKDGTQAAPPDPPAADPADDPAPVSSSAEGLSEAPELAVDPRTGLPAAPEAPPAPVLELPCPECGNQTTTVTQEGDDAVHHCPACGAVLATLPLTPVDEAVQTVTDQAAAAASSSSSTTDPEASTDAAP